MKPRASRRPFLAVPLLFALAAAPALAGDWAIDPARSHLSFVSVKSNAVAEINRFRELAGGIDAGGAVRVTLPLDSLDTLVPIRDERMRELLFQTLDYPTAELVGRIDPALIESLAPGEIRELRGEGRLSLRGEQRVLPLRMLAARVGETTLMVASIEPLIVDAAEFGLTAGIERLREIAGLPSIATAVPVNFVVTLVAAPAPAGD